MAGFGKMMKQMKKLQEDMQRAQANITNVEASGSAGGGVVTVRASGDKRILEIKIDPSVVSSDEVEMVEDLVLAAVNQALENVDQIASKEMESVTKGMNIPGLGL